MRRLLVSAALGLGVTPALAADAAALDAGPSLVTAAGMFLVVAFASVIGLSVVAKLLIVFGVVPREPETGLARRVHLLANIVGSIGGRRTSIDRRRADRDAGGRTARRT